MKTWYIGLVISLSLFVVCAPAIGQEESAEAQTEQQYKDIPYFSGMPSYVIVDAIDKEFESYNFFDGKKIVIVEGEFFRREYGLKEEGKAASALQIRRNYINAVKDAGGMVLFEGQCDLFDDTRVMTQIVTGKLSKDGREVWVEVAPTQAGDGYHLVVLRKEAMKQDVTSSGLLKALESDGRVALYINFDVNKSTIKPESKPIIEQIVGMMKENSGLRISIEGHTDNTGVAAKNKTLSEDRAKSVRDAIVSAGVEAARMSTVGWGQEKPIADNKTEEGKAKNRRVELVKK